MSTVLIDANCVLADPFQVATQGLLDNSIGMATLGWIIRVEAETPVVVVPSPPRNIGVLIGDPRREWWVRKDASDPWFGPLSYRDANSHARRMTVRVDNTIAEVKYAQVGTILGTRGGDPNVTPNMFVAYMYENGKQFLAGRMAEYNADRLPVT